MFPPTEILAELPHPTDDPPSHHPTLASKLALRSVCVHAFCYGLSCDNDAHTPAPGSMWLCNIMREVDPSLTLCVGRKHADDGQVCGRDRH